MVYTYCGLLSGKPQNQHGGSHGLEHSGVGNSRLQHVRDRLAIHVEQLDRQRFRIFQQRSDTRLLRDLRHNYILQNLARRPETVNFYDVFAFEKTSLIRVEVSTVDDVSV